MTKTSKPKQRSYQPPKHKYAIGTLVYFHAYADASDKTTYFLCQGYVVRQPKANSKVYKVHIVAVDPKSVLCGEKPEVAKLLLGMKIARQPDQLSAKSSGLMEVFYKDANWLHVKDRELKKIKASISRKR